MKTTTIFSVIFLVVGVGCFTNSRTKATTNSPTTITDFFEKKSFEKDIQDLLTSTSIDSVRWVLAQLLKKYALEKNAWQGKTYQKIFLWIDSNTIPIGYVNEQNIPDQNIRSICEKKCFGEERTVFEFKIVEFDEFQFKENDLIQININFANIGGEFEFEKTIEYKVKPNERKGLSGNQILEFQDTILNLELMKNLPAEKYEQVDNMRKYYFCKYARFWMDRYQIFRNGELVLENEIY